ncbi:MAG: flagellar basal body L-ring protein FlgH [bacterium]|nr:flagellar basal body L-ring protein FlgH [bacterium]
MQSLRPVVIALFLALCTAELSSAQNRITQGRRGSIYNPYATPIRMGASPTARRVGDLVTVVISETQDVKNEEKSDLTKDTSLNYSLTNFDVNPTAFSTLPALGGTRADSFAGSANYEKKGRFTARLTAVVVDSLPNGNLVIRGRREIRVDEEVKVIEIGGIIRRLDVASDNTVMSEQVAEARVSYSGSGPLSNSTRRHGFGGWLHGVLDWIWPF